MFNKYMSVSNAHACGCVPGTVNVLNVTIAHFNRLVSYRLAVIYGLMWQDEQPKTTCPLPF